LHAHYALVDDLFDRDCFRQKVEATIEQSGGLLDERTAAMLVVHEAGRHHLKITELQTSSSLVSFFCKVLSKSQPKEFMRSDGTPGLVSRMEVGDESGEVDIVLWDSRAAAISEINDGDVLEIVGRLKKPGEVHVLDMQKTACNINTRTDASLSKGPETLSVRLVHLEATREFTRRDGSAGQLRKGIIGNSLWTAGFVCWVPVLFDSVKSGDSICITHAVRNTRSTQREYIIGEKSTVAGIDETVEVLISPVSEFKDGQTISVQGEIVNLRPARTFTTRNGNQSCVRNAVLIDKGGDEIAVVIWGEQAEIPFMPGDSVEIFHAQCRMGRRNESEIHVGWQGVIRLKESDSEEITFEGTIVDGACGRCIDDGKVCYLIDYDLPSGAEVRVTGLLSGRRLNVIHTEAVCTDMKLLNKKLDDICG